ncbi:sensor histidine kinase [Melghirimyces algeriensis]|nr:HAMP domain-containing sensor histidine kinase [Melghirimyces algeriensis]
MKNDKMMVLIVLQIIVLTGLLIIDLNQQMEDVLKWPLVIALWMIAITFLLMRLRHLTQRKQINTALKRAINGNLKTRLLANQDQGFNESIFLINGLIEQMEKVQIESIKSQEERKRILSSISHDIRTPLTSIIGYIDALKDDIASSEEEKREYLEIISRKSIGLKHFLDELFNMAKIDANEISLKEERIDFAEITRESIIEFLPDLKKEGMELDVQIPEKHCFIMADRLSLMRVISNLIKNAVQYGNEGKVLGIELTETAQEYQLLIWDRGPGIRNADLGNVFERMYRGDQSRNHLHGGSGLGLAIAKALVEKNHGRIWVESTPWEKTTFGFSIPKQ